VKEKKMAEPASEVQPWTQGYQKGCRGTNAFLDATVGTWPRIG
jgi:hypothetical protein